MTDGRIVFGLKLVFFVAYYAIFLVVMNHGIEKAFR